MNKYGYRGPKDSKGRFLATHDKTKIRIMCLTEAYKQLSKRVKNLEQSLEEHNLIW
jgi:hypothetical protein